MATSCLSKRILIVDDNPIILKVLSSALNARGYDVVTAIDGPEAFGIVGQEQLDLVLLDIFFPPDLPESNTTWDAFLIMTWLKRMGGFHAKDVPVIIMSGAKASVMKERCLAAGAVGYFQKPVRIPELLHQIQEVLCSRVDEASLELAGALTYDRPRL
jgi:two-component system, OmpR family, KDP operon response regulator KdpE